MPINTIAAVLAVIVCKDAMGVRLETGKQAAIIHDSPVTGTKHQITYAQLQDRVARLAGALRAKGVEKGDRVIIYMPMIPQAIEAMLACARLGAIHSVVFGGFAAHNLALRIDDAQPKLLIAADAGSRGGKVIPYKPLVDEACAKAATPPARVLIVSRGLDAAEPKVAGRAEDYATLRAAVGAVTARHGQLRSYVDLAGYSEPVQIVVDRLEPCLEVTDLGHLTPAEQDAELTRWTEQERRRDFDLARAPLVRFRALHTPSARFALSTSFPTAVLAGLRVDLLIGHSRPPC